ncbi:MAG: hypothetical protein LBU77_05435 [Clostridiales bacterium]|jgi:hypothetical protein|nr:hypothetical protein [Clostridiales bacterium]
MEITIKAEPKEIAGIVIATQDQPVKKSQSVPRDRNETYSTDIYGNISSGSR